MKRLLLHSPAFGRDLRKWLKTHPNTAVAIEATLQLLSDDADQPFLRTHKLRGSLADSYACTAGYDLRIIFDYVEYENKAAIFVAIARHT